MTLTRWQIAADAQAELTALGLPARPVEPGELSDAILEAGLAQRDDYFEDDAAAIIDRLVADRRRRAERFALTPDGRIIVQVPGASADNFADLIPDLRLRARESQRAAIVDAATALHARGIPWERCAVQLGISRSTLERHRRECVRNRGFLNVDATKFQPDNRDAA